MATYRFVCEEHEDYGTNGWRLENTTLDPLGGMAVAHDILEHFAEKETTVASEFEALGASLYVRDGYHAHTGRYETRAGAHLAADFPDIMRHVLHRDARFPAPPKTYRLQNEDAEEQINLAIQEFRKNARDEFDSEEQRDLRGYYSYMRGWMRRGYRKAARRYRNVRQWDLMMLFCDIEKRADNYLKHAEVGDVLIVTVNRRDCTAKVMLDTESKYMGAY